MDTLLMGMLTVQPLWKILRQFLNKLKHGITK